jgi:hypothetical protein
MGRRLVFIFHRLVVDIGKNANTTFLTCAALVLVALCSQA